MASRMQVAGVLAARLGQDRRRLIQEAAAWLVTTGRVDESGYLARDVAAILSIDGYLLVKITSARALSPSAKAKVAEVIKRATSATELEIVIAVDPALVGGVLIEIPGATLDASIRTKLTSYVEGVIK